MLSRPVALGLRCVPTILASLLAVLISSSASAVAGPRVRYHVTAEISLREVDGEVEATLVNTSDRVLHEAVVVLFPNRFSVPDEGISDFNRGYVYPEKDFDPGGMALVEAWDGDRMVAADLLPDASETLAPPGQGLPDGCFARMPIAPLAPGASRRLRWRFRTTVPYRFGTFGHFEDQVTLVGGWYPYLAALTPDGSWDLATPPPLADFDATLAPSGFEVVVNGRLFPPRVPITLSLPDVHYVSLVAAPAFVRSEVTTDATEIVLLQRPARRTDRELFGTTSAPRILDAAQRALAQLPQVGLAAPAQLVIVEAPMRLNLVAAGEGAVIVSDRMLKVQEVIRPFHEMQLAQGAYAEWLRPSLARRESATDYWWVDEGLARQLADDFARNDRPDRRSVRDWIELFNIFAIVDRFESAPRIPCVDAFFAQTRVADPLHAEVATFNNSLPPGRVIMAKLRAAIGPAEFDAAIDRCIGGDEPFRRCMLSKGEPDSLIDQWLQPYPRLNYRFDSVRLNQWAGDAFRHTVTVRRDASRPVREPIAVRLRSIGGQPVDLRWNGYGKAGDLTVETPRRMWQALIDPDRQLIEDRRDDNASPRTPQVVLDSTDIEVSSTEFGISGLVVGRWRYDYRKDLAVAGFYTNRGIGFTSGARVHWGERLDAVSYRHNLYGFYGWQALDSGFSDRRQLGQRTSGQNAGIGMRYDYTNLRSFDNPSHQRQLRLYADWFDGALGGDYDYVDWGVNAVGTQPLWSYRAIGAVQILNGFSEPLAGDVVPNQGLYSLGGSRSIRGIGAEDELARNIFLVRTELRYDVYPELDLSLFDLIVVRRGQLRVFADTGRVSNSAGQVYDVSHFAAGVGVGLAANYDFLGFFPSLAYIELATRVDEPSDASDIQFLFGTRQAF